ncbi:MAG: TraB/GumN family protein [Candidatus Aenigmatarchaeota archaeon]
MIILVGTSHISPKSIKRIKEEMEKGPDCVAVELDEGRYRALKSGESEGYPSVFFRILSWIQKKLGEKTGVLPGEEMLTATEEAGKRGINVYLIDRPIHGTIQGFRKVGAMEKARLFLSSFLSFRKLKGRKFDLNEVPSYEIIKESLDLMEKKAPKMYSVLVEERNDVMATVLEELQKEEDTVLAVVGAGHLPGIKRRLDERDIEYVNNTFK